MHIATTSWNIFFLSSLLATVNTTVIRNWTGFPPSASAEWRASVWAPSCAPACAAWSLCTSPPSPPSFLVVGSSPRGRALCEGWEEACTPSSGPGASPESIPLEALAATLSSWGIQKQHHKPTQILIAMQNEQTRLKNISILDVR